MRRARGNTMPAQSAVLFLLSGFWFLATYNDGSAGFSALDKTVLFSLVGAVLAAQAAALAFAAFVRPPWGRRLLLALAVLECAAAVRYAAGISFVFVFTALALRAAFYGLFFLRAVRRFALCFEGLCAFFAVVNCYSLYLVFIADFDDFSGAAQLLMLAAAWVVARNFFASLAAAAWWRGVAAAAASVLFLAQVSQSAEVGEIFAAPPGGTSAQNVRSVKFVKKPNVYFFAFESMIPASLAKKHLHLDSLPHQEELESLGFRRFRNAFSDGPSTDSSLNRMLALDPAHYQKLAKEGRWRDLFPGLAPSPLLEIFRANGYSANVYNHDGFLGGVGGPYVDNYRVKSRYSLCFHPLLEPAFEFGFFGFCTVIYRFPRLTDALGLPRYKRFSPLDLLGVKQYLDSVLTDIAAAKKPAAAFVRIHSLGHLWINYDGGDEDFQWFRKLYAGLSAQTRPLMGEIVRFVRENDPGAIVFVFGDHGVQLSLPLGEMAKLNAAEKQFAIRDRYGVLAAAYPASACRESFDKAEARGFVTNSIIARAVVRCLAGGEDPAIGEWEYLVRDETAHGRRDAILGWYENHLYE